MSAKGPKGASAPSKTASGPGPTGKAAAASAEEKAMLEARAALAAKFGAAGARIGGKGTVRRKAAAVPKASAADDKKLTSALKRLSVNAIPGIEEVMIVKDDGSAVVFQNPKVQASIASNTYVVSGTSENKSAEEVAMGMAMSAGSGLAGINPAQLKALQEALKASGGNLGAAGLGGGDAADEDEGLPELEGDFEASA